MSQLLKFLKSPIESFKSYQERRRQHEALQVVFRYERQGKYCEAAAVYREMAREYITSNELIYASDLQEAIKLWLKAGDVDNAMVDARSVLSVLAESGWLKDSDEGVESLGEIVGEFFVAGYEPQANAFIDEVNEQLARFGHELLRGKSEQTTQRKCPHCGAAVSVRVNSGAVRCEYCKEMVSSQ
jgi:hypothetical protein